MENFGGLAKYDENERDLLRYFFEIRRYFSEIPFTSNDTIVNLLRGPDAALS